jgi:hypothetical protein
MARNKAGHPLCRHERTADARELCTRWWCGYRLEVGFYTLCAAVTGLAWPLHFADRPVMSRHASHSICLPDGTCSNNLGQRWHQQPGSLPRLGPDG